MVVFVKNVIVSCEYVVLVVNVYIDVFFKKIMFGIENIILFVESFIIVIELFF